MSGDGEKLVQEYQQMNKTAFVLGYSGQVGSALVQALLSSRIFAKVVLIGRRTVTYEDELYKDVVSSSAVTIIEIDIEIAILHGDRMGSKSRSFLFDLRRFSLAMVSSQHVM